MDTRTKVKEAFKILRKNQIMARGNYLCCSTCAGYALAESLDKMPTEKAEKKIGFAYWHRQDEEHFQKRGDLYIRYGGIDTQKYPNRCDVIGWSTKQIGEAIKIAMEGVGLEVEWDGNPDKTIVVREKSNV